MTDTVQCDSDALAYMVYLAAPLVGRSTPVHGTGNHRGANVASPLRFAGTVDTSDGVLSADRPVASPHLQLAFLVVDQNRACTFGSFGLSFHDVACRLGSGPAHVQTAVIAVLHSAVVDRDRYL